MVGRAGIPFREWIACAKEVLAFKGIEESEFTAAIRSLLQLGRGNHRNILIVRPANSAKTFMLMPNECIF